MPANLRRWLAELIGTYGFVAIGAAAGIVSASKLGDAGLLGVAIGNGVALAVMITAVMAVSGGHLNPAVTLSMWLGRKIESVDAIGYVVAQLLGALGAGVTVRVIFSDAVWRAATLGSPQLGQGVTPAHGILVEAVFTFFLLLVIWGTAVDDRAPSMGGLFIGLFVVTGVLAIGPLTGGAFNPARYFGPAVIAGQLHDWWVYFVGPGIGGAVAGLLYPTLFMGGFPWAPKPEAAPEPPPPAAPRAGRPRRSPR
jgi:aquaporin TIP